ncbi:hypothetical protein [Geosporobacter ferrireducens]|uniref:hypothetical protein n=1 Tax=Geosporobacter ferrireducens TaxID=1424294 RepID=UPI00139B3483|nr:hypothetical protein [Geosporobacter ferrireducens]MTI57495.1 hypothetical protein [Geosporobacter ferrireducens]
MPSMNKTTNYALNQWLGNEYPKRQDFVEDNAKIEAALTPEADPAKIPASNGPFKIVDWTSYFANRIKAIVGKGNWWDTPTKSMEQLSNEVAAHKAESIIHTASGAANSIIVTTGGNFFYTSGSYIKFKAISNNTGNVTINIDGKGSKPIKKLDGSQIPAGGIKNGKVYEIYYDSGNDCFFLLARAEGDATAVNVLAGKTFSNDDDIGITGTMINKGVKTFTPSATIQTDGAGYYSSVSCNAVAFPAANVLAGTTIAGTAGSMPNRGAVTITPNTANQTIAAGYHNGSGIVIGSSNLVPSNIKNGVNIFGVIGTYGSAVTGLTTLGVWATISATPTAHTSYSGNWAGVGTVDSAVIYSDGDGIYSSARVQQWNGITWSTISNPGRTASGQYGGTGTSSDWLLNSGNGGSSTLTAKFNGTSWSTITGFGPSGIQGIVGTSSLALSFGGTSGSNSPSINTCMSYDGTTWSTLSTTLPATRCYNPGVGTPSSVYSIGGNHVNTSITWILTNTVYSFNGTSWSTQATLSANRAQHGAAGSTSNCITYGGMEKYGTGEDGVDIYGRITLAKNTLSWYAVGVLPYDITRLGRIGDANNALAVSLNGMPRNVRWYVGTL